MVSRDWFCHAAFCPIVTRLVVPNCPKLRCILEMSLNMFLYLICNTSYSDTEVSLDSNWIFLGKKISPIGLGASGSISGNKKLSGGFPLRSYDSVDVGMIPPLSNSQSPCGLWRHRNGSPDPLSRRAKQQAFPKHSHVPGILVNTGDTE